MAITSSDTNVSTLIVNKCTKDQYDAMTSHSGNELYVVNEDIDSSPTQNSTNPVTSGGVYTALSGKQNTLTFDNTPTTSSNNPVTSNGIKEYIDSYISNLQNQINELKSLLPAYITDVTTFNAAVPNTATEIMFAYERDEDLTGYTKSGSIGDDIDVYVNGTKYAIVSNKTIFAPEISMSMFYGYASLASLDLSNFNTANVTTMAHMFEECSALTTLDLSNFNTANVTKMTYMFEECSLLTTIYGTDWNAASVSSSNMFNGCTSLVGGNGTTYNSSYKDATYAHIDVAGNPGYFTAPPQS